MLFYEKTEAESVIIEFVLKAVEWMGTRGFTHFIQAYTSLLGLLSFIMSGFKELQEFTMV